MKQVLLAINGPDYRKEAVRYALGLAQRIRAQLAVLQVLRSPAPRVVPRVGANLSKGARTFEKAMVGATYAEAGEPDTALQLERDLGRAAASLTETDGPAVDYRVVVKTGRVDELVSQFIREHPEAVLAVYDGPEDQDPGGRRSLVPGPGIPVVSLKKKQTWSEKGGDMPNPVVKKKSGAVKAAETFETVHQAVTYAEADVPEEAVRILDQHREPALLLVLGRGHGFSQMLKDYAVDLAGRLGYAIVAVNNKYIPQDFLPLVSQYRQKLREDFSRLANESAREFQRQCEEAGIRFRHLVKFGEATDVLRELHREFKTLDYVVSEPSEEVRSEPGASPAIPVFSLKMT